MSGDGSGFFISKEKCVENVNKDEGFRNVPMSLVTDQGGYQQMSVLMGIQGDIQN